MVRSLYVTLVLLIITLRIGVNYTNKQSHIVSSLSLVFNITIPYVSTIVSVNLRPMVICILKFLHNTIDRHFSLFSL